MQIRKMSNPKSQLFQLELIEVLNVTQVIHLYVHIYNQAYLIRYSIEVKSFRTIKHAKEFILTVPRRQMKCTH